MTKLKKEIKTRKTKAERDKSFNLAVKEIKTIIDRAVAKHGDFATLHHAFGVMYEEVDEFWDEVKKKKPNKKNTRLELLQIAAVCLKTLDIL